MEHVVTLFRPVGAKELELFRQADFTAFPARLIELPMNPNILSAICSVLAIILVFERPASANERKGANICAIEIMQQRIWNDFKASV
jgi:hypothetical protein